MPKTFETIHKHISLKKNGPRKRIFCSPNGQEIPLKTVKVSVISIQNLISLAICQSLELKIQSKVGL